MFLLYPDFPPEILIHANRKGLLLTHTDSRVAEQKELTYKWRKACEEVNASSPGYHILIQTSTLSKCSRQKKKDEMLSLPLPGKGVREPASEKHCTQSCPRKRHKKKRKKELFSSRDSRGRVLSSVELKRLFLISK